MVLLASAKFGTRARSAPLWKTVDFHRHAATGLESFHWTGASGARRAHLSESHVLVFVHAGGGLLRARGRDHELRAPVTLVVEPDEYIVWTADEASALGLLEIHVPPAVVGSLLLAPTEPRPSGVLRVSGSLVAESVEELAAAIASDEATRDIGGFVARLSAGWKNAAPLDEQPPPFCAHHASKARDFLEGRASAKVTLADLERLTRRNRFEIVRSFKRAFGVTPLRFQAHRRVANARALLRRGYRPVDVAREVGFFDQSHLHRHFKNFIGVTPADYRRGMLSD